MKLRIRGNSLRLRLTQSEIAQFGETGKVEEMVEFGFAPGESLIYALETDPAATSVGAAFENNRLRVLVPSPEAEKWVRTAQTGIAAEQPIGNQKNLRILIEKDFACLEKRPGDEDRDAFPHPREFENENC